MTVRNSHSCAKCETDCGRLCCTKIENCNVVFGKSQILKDINIHIHCGELTALIGTNGAGKSTLLKAILGEVPHSGALSYLDAKGIRSGHPLIGYVPQHLSFDLTTPTSVFDLFMACLSNIPSWITGTRKLRSRISQSLEKVKADHLIDKRLGALSGGELQRILLALALEPVPDLLLLDEPLSGIDRNGLEMFYNIVSELRENFDLSIILVSHDLDLVAKYADRVILLKGSVICSGTPQEVFGDPRTKEEFGMLWCSENNAAARPMSLEERL